ncbi:MAG: hypothetical protein IVW57_17170, partial [Ktedonobacterales bacterium]|nr:hypothetical protein [Ktedonobacterales bacterium]
MLKHLGRHRGALIGCAAVCLVGAWLVVSLTRASAATRDGAGATIGACAASAAIPANAPGGPALHPHLNLNNPCLPTFTADEAAQYALTQPLLRTIERGARTVAKVEFTTATALHAQLQGEEAALPSGPIAVVDLRGTFVTAKVVGPSVYRSAVVIFDGRSGNLLSIG